jgi:hypothetical protein
MLDANVLDAFVCRTVKHSLTLIILGNLSKIVWIFCFFENQYQEGQNWLKMFLYEYYFHI